ncbi:MAG: hypothetical protein PF440_01925, partial [Thiomicrorhabdus sp.]|nr:hypothetical protein [Thiomicrorhabdus sp.]
MSDGTGAGIWTATSSLGLLGSSTISNLTNNYISKWNGTAFANSVLYDNGTNLALGTTTASSLLTVGATSTDQFLVNNIGQVTDGTWTGDTIGLAYGGTGNTTFTNGSIVFSNGTILTEDNSSFFWDDTNKYLGLGTSSPRSQLEVYSGSADSILTITSANGTNDPLIQFLTGTSSTAKFTMGVDATDSNKFKIAPGTSLDGSDVFVIDEYGNTIISNLQLGAQVFAADSGAITWTDMPVTSAVPAGTEQSLSALIDGETMLTLYAESDGLGGIQNQRIGVGTSSPQSMLTVYGDVLVEGANRYLNFGATTSDVGYGFYDNGGTIQIKHDNGTWTDIGSGVVNSGTAGYLPYFATTGTSLTATSAIFLLNEMIGIGTTSPSSMFTVGATSTNQFLVNNIGQILDGTWMGDTIGLAYGGTGNTAFTNGSIVFSNGTILTQDNSNFFWDDSNNYLGLGTSTPSAILTVGATSTDQFLVNNIGQITDGTWMGDTVGLAYGGTGNTSFTNGSIVFSNGTILTQDNSNFFWDDANSYLGLGTSTPNYLLDITASSSANYLTSIYNTGTATTSGGLFVRSDGEGALLNLNYNGTDVFTVTGAETSFNNPVSFGSTGDVSFGNDLVLNNDTASHITFTSAGYIETDSTWQNLDLTLSAAQLGDVIVDDTFVVTGTTTIADLLYVNYADEKIGIGTSTPAATLDIFGTAGGNIMNVASSSGDSLFHISENGNVGIGTTSPSSILTVGATSTDQFLVNNIGQITDGTWMGDTIDIAYGGTGVTNVADFLN